MTAASRSRRVAYATDRKHNRKATLKERNSAHRNYRIRLCWAGIRGVFC